MSLIRKILLHYFSHHTLALLRWDLHFLRIRIVNFLLTKGKLNWKLNKLGRPLYLNLGSGSRGVQDAAWLNVDGYQNTNVDFLMDFNRTFPFPDNSFDGIFCEHVLEHFTIADGQRLLRECWRVLHPGGCIRIIVPDGVKIMRAYFDNPEDLIRRREEYNFCAMETVNSYFRQRYEHQIAYDAELLERQFLRAGFDNVATVSFRNGEVSRAVILDHERYEWESLYMEARKPCPL